MARLAAGDRRGCRAELAALVERVSAADSPDSRPIWLIAAVLERLSGEILRQDGDLAAHRARRALVVERLSGCTDARAARRRALALLAELLASPGERRATLPPLVRRAQSFVEQHYARPLSLSAVARALDVSPSHLARSFGEATNTTLTAYVHQVRLAHALPLLERGDRRVSEVAYAVGYQTYRDFHRNFVKQQRISPRAWTQRRRDTLHFPASSPRRP
jgi:AraC-like DNA-binding protein